MDSTSFSPLSSTKLSEMPFEDLPNLPKPVIPRIDFGIERMELEEMLKIRPSLPSFRKIGHSVVDHCTQTDNSDILDLKYIIEMLRTLTLDTGQLRKDLTSAHSVLKATYEKQIGDRSMELYCRINEKLIDLEEQHKKKIETVRKSYQTQLENAIKAISGEYKTYYDEILQGKTGHHDVIIKDLKDQVIESEVLAQQQNAVIEELQKKLKEINEADNEREPSPPSPPPGISLEEAQELEKQINNLLGEVNELKDNLALQEDENNQLNKQVESLNKQLSDQKSKYKQLEKDMENFKKKAKQEQEKATRMAQNQVAAMEKEMKAKMEQAEKEAAQKAQEQAEIQRMRDQAKFQEEIEKRRNMEDQLWAQAAQQKPADTIGDQELLLKIRGLQDTEEKQKNTILRLEKELERTNRTWELKMMVMRKNFHALKDEFFIRHTLQRQSAALHHASVGYAVNGETAYNPKRQSKELRPLPSLKLNNHSSLSPRERASSCSMKLNRGIKSPVFEESVPPPSPNTMTAGQSPRTVHFGEEESPLNPRPLSRTEYI